jgi:hypothetical protein
VIEGVPIPVAQDGTKALVAPARHAGSVFEPDAEPLGVWPTLKGVRTLPASKALLFAARPSP